MADNKAKPKNAGGGRGFINPPTVGEREMMDQYNEQKQRKAEENAPTTKTEMGKLFKKGGVMKKKYAEGGDVPDRVYAEDAGISPREEESTGNAKSMGEMKTSSPGGMKTPSPGEMKTPPIRRSVPGGKPAELITPSAPRRMGQISRLADKSKTISDEDKEEAGARLGKVALLAASGPLGRATIPVTAREGSRAMLAAQAARRAERGMAGGGSVSASRRGDGIAQRGKTKGRMI